MKCDAATYQIKRLHPDNISDIGCLYRTVYHRFVGADFLLKKYNTAYTGVSYLGFIAYNGAGMPVAFYGAIPCFIQHQSKAVLTAQSADAMTHPEYRNQGLFVKLAALTFELCKEKGIRLVFGFPNQLSKNGLVDTLAWQETEMMDCFVIPINRFAWDSLLKKIPLLNSLYKMYATYILKKHIIGQPGLNNSVLNEGFDGVHRTDEYLKYKTCNDTKVIRANQALIWVKINNGLVIGDICLATENFDGVMRKVKRLARKIGVKQIMFHASPGTRLHQLFNDRYWSFPSFPVIFKDMGSRLPLNRIKFTTADIDTF